MFRAAEPEEQREFPMHPFALQHPSTMQHPLQTQLPMPMQMQQPMQQPPHMEQQPTLLFQLNGPHHEQMHEHPESSLIGAFHKIRIPLHQHHIYHPSEHYHNPQPVFQAPAKLMEKFRAMLEGDELEDNDQPMPAAREEPHYNPSYQPPAYQQPHQPVAQYQAPVAYHQPAQYHAPAPYNPPAQQHYQSPVQCGSNLLIGCQPQVQQVPCSAPPQYGQSYAPAHPQSYAPAHPSPYRSADQPSYPPIDAYGSAAPAPVYPHPYLTLVHNTGMPAKDAEQNKVGTTEKPIVNGNENTTESSGKQSGASNSTSPSKLTGDNGTTDSTTTSTEEPSTISYSRKEHSTETSFVVRPPKPLAKPIDGDSKENKVDDEIQKLRLAQKLAEENLKKAMQQLHEKISGRSAMDDSNDVIDEDPAHFASPTDPFHNRLVRRNQLMW